MKLKIKVKMLNGNCIPFIIEKGDWIDLRAAKDVKLDSPYAKNKIKQGDERSRTIQFDSAFVPLGIAMELPSGYEAIVAPRSSSFKNFGFIVPNSFGVIDNSYNSDTDEWHLPVVSLRGTSIKAGDRICQFRIRLSQKANFIQKLKWLFTSQIELVVVDSLGNDSRGGFGSTGVK